MIDVIGLDADDTLWHSQNHYEEAQQAAAVLLADWIDPPELDRRLLAVERVNVGHYGFGVKSFTLSLIETAIDVSGGRVDNGIITGLMEIGKELLEHPVELIDGAEQAVEALRSSHELVVITKGDLRHQERKLDESGLTDAFHHIRIVSDKDPQTYRRVAAELDVAPARMLMVGNSVRSDVLPAREAGLHAVHVPYHLLWSLEQHDGDDAHDVPTLESLHDLPDHVARLGERR